MSPKSLPIPAVPDEAPRVAHVAFPAVDILLQLRDTLGTSYTDEQFADLLASRSQPAFALRV
jgi:hypothetical protein